MKDKNKVIVALSGGVDSSAAAYLLLEQGYQVEAATLDLGLGAEAAQAAADICAKLGIKHHIIDCKAAFKQKVIEPFIRAYGLGLTPNPCTVCNPSLKFPSFWPLMAKTDSYYLATGHYVRLFKDDQANYRLAKAAYLAKDQSYFLYDLGQDILKHCLFPLSDFTKDEIRAKAHQAGLSVAQKKDSQDICFIKGDYRDFIRPHLKALSGAVVDSSGKLLGQHQGLYNYTIGQRKGLGLALGYPAYIIGLDTAQNRVIVGTEQELSAEQAWLNNINLAKPLGQSFRAQVKIRYKSPPAMATVHLKADNCAQVIFDEPVKAITPGQAAVFYDQDLLLGGGLITDAKNAT